MEHQEISANKDTIPKLHQQARDSVFNWLRKQYKDEKHDRKDAIINTASDQLAYENLQKVTENEYQKKFEKERSNRNEELKFKEIESKIGLFPIETLFRKENDYWTAMSRWTDKRNGRTYTLKTRKDEKGVLRTFLNEESIFDHLTEIAEETYVRQAHKSSKKRISELACKKYIDNNQITLEKIFEFQAK